MLGSSIKKYSINNELERLLKSCAIDSEINKNGNIIRLEEIIIPNQDGMYKILYKNPSNGDMYSREGIPETVAFTDIYNRTYSFPRKDLSLNFKLEGGDEILTSSDVNNDLNIKENIISWRSAETFKELNLTENVRKYITNLYKNYNLLPILRRNYFNETGTDKIKFKENNQKRIKLMNCIKELSIRNLVDASVKRQIAQEFNKETQKQKMNSKVLELIYTYNIFPEEKLEELLEIAANNPETINEALREASGR